MLKILFHGIFWLIPLGAQAQGLPYPRYLKVWNESVSTKEVLTQLGTQVSPEYRHWLLTRQRATSPQKSSIEFLDRDQFFLKSRPTGLHLIHTGRLSEGQILVARKPFNFSDDESLAQIGKRLEAMTGTQKSPGHWAPVLALIDLERRKRQSLAGRNTVAPTSPRSTDSGQAPGGLR